MLLIAGGVGETYMLEDGEFGALAELVVDEAKGETPTMVMVAELSARRAARKARTAADAGVDYVLLSPPHYSLPSEDDIFLHHQYVNDAADIGLVLYNSYWVMPQPGYSFSPGLFERLARLENIVGIKWSAITIDQYVGMQQQFGDRFNFIENTPFFSQGSRFGMRAFVDIYGNVAPRLSLHLIDLVRHGRFDEYDEIQKQLRFDPVYGKGGSTPPLLTNGGRRAARADAPGAVGARLGAVLPRPGAAWEGLCRIFPGLDRDRRSHGLGRLEPVHSGVAGPGAKGTTPGRLITVGCEYAGKTTLAENIAGWISRIKGGGKVYQ